jgi:hypothetical protein
LDSSGVIFLDKFEKRKLFAANIKKKVSQKKLKVETKKVETK